MATNRLTECLGLACKEYLVNEKWLLAPTLRIGNQWLQSVAGSCQPVLNVHVKTLRGLAIELASGQMASTGKTLITSQAGAMLVDSVWSDLSGRGDEYLGKLDRTPNLSASLFRAIEEIRLSNAARIDPGAFEVLPKGHDIQALLEQYVAELKGRNLVDYADVLKMAKAHLQGSLYAIRSDLIVLMPVSTQTCGLERALIETIPKSQLISIEEDEPERTREPKTDLALLAWALNPGESPEPAGDGTVQLYRALGEVNEVREVFRRCVAEGISLDEVEVLHSETATYVPLVFEEAQRLQAVAPALTTGVPVTFAEGIPASYSRPGRALSAWLNWISNDFPQLALVRMIHDGLLTIDNPQEQSFSTAALAGLLRAQGIGLGRDRYLIVLDQHIKARQRVEKREKSSTDRQLIGLKILRQLIDGLLAISHPPSTDPLVLLDNAARFIDRYARSLNQQDSYACDVMRNQIKTMRHWVELCGAKLKLDLYAWLKALPTESRILGSGPMAGAMHLAHVLRGGHTGRKYTFFLGLDDGRFPGPVVQDPILLDSERARIDKKLTTSASRLNERLAQFARTLCRIRGQATLSYSCHDLRDDRETFPASLLLAVYRLISGKRSSDQSELLNWLGPAVSFAPNACTKATDVAEWWLWKLCGGTKVLNAPELIGSEFPHLQRGALAAAARRSSEFTEFDGFVPEAANRWNLHSPNGPVVSASALELAGKCPLAFFYRYVLKLKPLDELALDLDRWLDPLAHGALLHEVFREFMVQLAEMEQRPDYQKHRGLLGEILDREIERYRGLYPPPSETSCRQQCRLLERAIDIFLKHEQVHCQNSQPVFMEASIGLRADPGSETEIDHPDPVAINLGGGKALRTHGRIDRVDRLDDHNYALWDYKTGSSYGYDRQDPFKEGRRIQPVLYVSMAAEALRASVDKQAIVEQFGYFFTGDRGEGERIGWTAEKVSEGIRHLELLSDIISSGCYLPTTDEGDCRFCDFTTLCGNLKAVTGASEQKMKDSTQEGIRAFRRLRLNV